MVAERNAARAPGPVASYLGFLLRRARVTAERLVPDVDLAETVRHVAILSVLTHVGPTSQQWLADYLGINRSVMVRLVDVLEEHGDLLRSRSSTDRRSYALATTPAGAACLAARGDRMAAIGRELSEGLSAAEVGRLVQLLERLTAGSFVPPLPPLLKSDLVFLVTETHQRLEVDADRELRPFGSSVRTYVTLAKLQGSACSQIDLASHLLVGAAAVVELVDSLEQAGLVVRERSRTDRRSYELRVTAAGETAREHSAKVIRQVTENFTRGLSGKQNDELFRLLAGLRSPESLLPAS